MFSISTLQHCSIKAWLSPVPTTLQPAATMIQVKQYCSKTLQYFIDNKLQYFI